jgi:cysteine synthase A
MANIYDDNSYSIGKTPLVRLNRLPQGKAQILAKIEGRNPAYSVKCRIGASMVWDAEKKGMLKPGKVIVEPTSGNTGIALAFTAAARGYSLILTMPDTMSVERRKLLKAFGAELYLTEGSKGMKAIHETTTGPEIWEDTDGDIDVLVAGVGTGGTLTGISRFFKNKMGKKITTVAVEPAGSPVISQTLAGEEIKPGPHKIQGIGAGFIPDNLDLSMIDRVEQVENEEAIEFARRLPREEGILAGLSCGAAAAVAVRIGKLDEFGGKTIVVILPDSGERYLSTILYEGLFDANSGL